MFNRRVELAFYLIMLLFLVSCAASTETVSVPAEEAAPAAEAIGETVEEAMVEEVFEGEEINPVAILIIDDFGPPPRVVAETILEMPEVVVAEEIVAPEIVEVEAIVEEAAEEEAAPEVVEVEVVEEAAEEEAAPETEAMELAAEAFVDLDLLQEQVLVDGQFLLTDDVCLITPHGVNHYNLEELRTSRGQGMGDLPPELQVDEPHGELVYKQLVTSLEGGGNSAKFIEGFVGNQLFDDMEWLRDVELWEVNEGHILVAKIDTFGFTTDAIGGNIETMLEILAYGDQAQAFNPGLGVNLGPAQGVVLNMSFAMVPCNISSEDEVDVDQLVGAFALALEGIGAASAQVNQPAVDSIADRFSEVSNLYSDIPTEEAQEALNELFFRTDSAPVLAQREFRSAVINEVYGPSRIDFTKFVEAMSECDGNQEVDPLCTVLENVYNYPIPVIPVAAAGNSALNFPFFPAAWGSTVSIGSTGADYSNKSEVTVDGTYELHHDDGSISFVEGTSFAAPRFSRLAAIYLLRYGNAACAGETPPLGYGYITNEMEKWEHLALEDAVAKYCADFPTE